MKGLGSKNGMFSDKPMSKIVSTKFYVNTIFLRVFMEEEGGGGLGFRTPGLRSYKRLGPNRVKSLFNCNFD